MKKFLILIIVVFIFMTGCGSKEVEMKTINYDDVNEIIENYENLEHVFIIDVREVSEFNEGHLINAYNIPLGKIESIEYSEGISKDSKIIVYCRSGNRSKMAQTRLMDIGYTEVYDMGGITDWPYDVVKSDE